MTDDIDPSLLIIALKWASVGNTEQLHAYREAAQQSGNNDFLDYLETNGVIDSTVRDAVYARARGWDAVNLTDYPLDEEVLALIPPGVARDLNVVPVYISEGNLSVATSNPADPVVERRLQLELASEYRVRLMYASTDKIRKVVNDAYSASGEASRLVSDGIGAGAVGTGAQASTSPIDLGDLGEGDSEVVKLVRLMIEQAIRDRASDIHIEPTDGRTIIRYRVDGVLRIQQTHTSEVGNRMVAYIKVRAGMRGDETRVGQDGPLEEIVNRKKITIRAVTLPGVFGEDVIMRLQADMSRPLEELGFSPYNLEEFRKAITQPYGMVLVTGPTGSGKSTTLYSALGEVQDEAKKIITVEDPVETRMPPGITQVQVHARAGWTFDRSLRSILRSDPDIILLGEIRDDVTAKTAVDAAMTGHLMLSTLHTNDAPSALDRLMELGVAPSMAGESLLQVLAQRLIRRLCVNCKIPTSMNLDEVHASGFGWVTELPETIYTTGPGCEECRYAGYRGRVAVHEIMNVNEEIRALARRRSTVAEIANAAHKNGMTSLRQDGWYKISTGDTDVKELNRVIANNEDGKL